MFVLIEKANFLIRQNNLPFDCQSTRFYLIFDIFLFPFFLFCFGSDLKLSWCIGVGMCDFGIGYLPLDVTGGVYSKVSDLLYICISLSLLLEFRLAHIFFGYKNPNCTRRHMSKH